MKQPRLVTDSTRPITPTFYHEDLARAALKELSKDLEGLELRKDVVLAFLQEYEQIQAQSTGYGQLPE